MLSVPTPLRLQVTGVLEVRVMELPGVTTGFAGVSVGPEARADAGPFSKDKQTMRQSNALILVRAAESSAGGNGDPRFI